MPSMHSSLAIPRMNYFKYLTLEINLIFRITFKIFVTLFMLTSIACSTDAKKSTEQTAVTPAPKLSKPVVRKIWIPPEVRNNGAEWVEGHFLFRIEKETVWSR